MASVLLIDDDHEVRATLERCLVEVGHDVLTAGNGLDGFRYFREQPRDVVITDLAMPEQDGLETIAGIKREFPGARIIAIADPGSDKLLNLASALGASHTLQKPIGPDELIALVGALTLSL